MLNYVAPSGLVAIRRTPSAAADYYTPALIAFDFELSTFNFELGAHAPGHYAPALRVFATPE
jgi:hypothetical protein